MLQYSCPELRRVEHRGKAGDRRSGRAAAVLDLRPAPPRLGRDQDDAVGGVRPIDRRSRRVFEDRDARDVRGVQEVESVAPGRGVECVTPHGNAATGAGTYRHAVDDVERLAAGVDRCRAANPDRETATRLVVVHELDAGDLVLDELLRADDTAGIELLLRDLSHGAGDVAGPLLPVAGHHNFRQAYRLGGKADVEDAHGGGGLLTG